MRSTPFARSVRHTSVEPVFVVGSVRSGTTMMCRLLLDFLGVNFGTESQFFLRYHHRLAAYGNLGEDARMRLLLDDIRRERFFMRTRENFGFELDAARALSNLRGRTYPNLLRSIFEQFASQQGLQRWGDKTPAYARDLPTLSAMFPNAQYVHMLRDGRDVATSVFKTPFGAKNAYEAAIEWRASVASIWKFSEQIPAERFFEVRYEQLLDDPVLVLTALARYLGVVDPHEVIGRAAPQLCSVVREQRTERWRTTLTRNQLACFETFAGTELRRGGFALSQQNRRVRAPRLSEGIYWRVQGACKRLRMRKYWADNWYKLRLRARAAALPFRRITTRPPRAA